MSAYYFSRAVLRPDIWRQPWMRQAAAKGDMYRDHAAIWRLFPGADGVNRDFLFRRYDEPGADPFCYVVSRRKPQGIPGVLEVETKPYDPHFGVGERLRFSLRANPTVSRGPAGSPSKRHDVLMDAKKRATAAGTNVTNAIAAAGTAWFTDRAERMGIGLEADVMHDGYHQHRVARNGKSFLSFSTLDYEGWASVVDGDQLRQVLFEGMGHSKGFGCGLLLVRRVE